LTVGHSDGLSSILVPGSGEPNFDSAEADPFENKKARREREVKSLLEKVRATSCSQSFSTYPFAQIQPDMIALDPEFVGSLAPPSKLTTTTNGTTDTPFARLPRLERLRVQGKADETEIANDEENPNGKNQDREEREKRKMRGKGKSMKRLVHILFLDKHAGTDFNRYLRKQRKNVIDPTAVRFSSSLYIVRVLMIHINFFT
jgi:U3 small nucleolar RNA-associated protein 7